MGGTNLLVKPLPESVNEQNYEKVLQLLDLRDLPAQDRVKTLREIPAEELLAVLPPELVFLPTSGGDLDLPINTFEEIYMGESQGCLHPGKLWCKQIMIGDCQMDVSHVFSFETYQGYRF
jgi:hypothetical protein